MFVTLNRVWERGGLAVYRRKPVPLGVTRYVVGRTGFGEPLLKDFRRLRDAVRWAEKQPEGQP